MKLSAPHPEPVEGGVVVGIASSTHRADQAVVLENVAVGCRGVLRTAIGMMNASGGRPAGADRRLQRRNREPRIDRAADAIADNLARPGIEDGCQVDESGCDRHVGNVRHWSAPSGWTVSGCGSDRLLGVLILELALSREVAVSFGRTAAASGAADLVCRLLLYKKKKSAHERRFSSVY